ncbi:MAG: hypothetical protein ON057_001659 [Glomeribacter sp. 1016415]|uniref:hypothetical protein n=1 Tax=Mycoavidus cysteinexigens TaxID=1553431 RepID=UPI00034B923C|nr:hypothetical protein [Mycoavidus cysteinexigens]MCX8566932.1 hypothetical protein [Glomeribacter sp. 1016415]GAM51729.1 hypothetical protein EBME_0192 [bacterium endosymbiont of Mortierella elongata FMR23-6]
MPLFLRWVTYQLCHNRNEIFRLQRAYQRYANASPQAAIEELRAPRGFHKPRLSLAWACCRLTLEQPTLLPTGILAFAGLLFVIALHCATGIRSLK